MDHRISRQLALLACLSFPAALFAQATPDDSDPRVTALSSDANAAKISTQLLRLEQQQQSLGSRVFLLPAVRAMAKGKRGVLVEAVLTRADAPTIAKLSVAGAVIKNSHPQFGRVTLEVTDLAALHQIAALPEVTMVRPAYRSRTRTNNGNHSGTVNSRDRVALNADILVTTFGLTGAGQTIGIISDSFAVTDGVRDGNTLPAAGVAGTLTGARNQDSGDLPASVNLLADDTTGFDEGAGMAELVHDVAPGAAIAFHASGATEADFATGIGRLRTEAGATVLVDDIGFLDEPYYQTGLGAQAELDAIKAGVPYFTAAGNDENRCLRQPYKDVQGAQTDPKAGKKAVRFTHLHNWGSGNAFLPVTVAPNDYALAVLQWNQPFQSLNSKAGSQVDFDLYVVDTPDLAALPSATNFSAEIQGKTKKGRGDAFEAVEIDNNDPSLPHTFYVVVDHIQGNFDKIPQDNTTPLEITMMFPFSGDVTIGGIPNNTSAFGGPTAFGHVQTQGVISVGAIPWWESPQFNPAFTPTSGIDPEPYSSRGGFQTVFFDRLGRLDPKVSYSPILTGVDGCSTSFFYSNDSNLPGFLTGYQGEPDGHPNFFGTSAAAPTVAAVAALLQQFNPTLTGKDVKSVMLGSAIDITGARTSAGNDDVTGYGIVDATAALATLGNLPNLAPYTPPGLSSAFVLSQVTGATADGPLKKGAISYATISVQNNGTLASVFGFLCSISIDGIEVATRIVTTLNAGSNTTLADIQLPKLKPGQHTFTLKFDSTDNVVETSNADNVVTRILTVTK